MTSCFEQHCFQLIMKFYSLKCLAEVIEPCLCHGFIVHTINANKNDQSLCILASKRFKPHLIEVKIVLNVVKTSCRYP